MWVLVHRSQLEDAPELLCGCWSDMGHGVLTRELLGRLFKHPWLDLLWGKAMDWAEGNHMVEHPGDVGRVCFEDMVWSSGR